MLRKLWPLLLLAGCFQQGLVATDKEPVESGVNGGSTGDDAPEELTAKIRTERRTGTAFTLTSFAKPAYPVTKPIKGYGDGDSINGETFCFSNENEANTNTFDSVTDCRRPLDSQLMPTAEHDLAAEFETLTTISSPTKTPFVLQALQLYFSNSTSAPLDLHFSAIDTTNLKISVKTAPLLFEAESGYFYWRPQDEKSHNYNYSSSGNCTLGEENAVGFDLRYDTKIMPVADRYKHFITGLWVFERALTRPFEAVAKSSNPVPSFSNGTSGPHNLFSSRTNVFGSLLVPEMGDDENGSLSYKFFPGKDPQDPLPPFSPMPVADPYKYTFGYYRHGSVSGVSTAGEENRNASQHAAGAFVTPVMGKYHNGGAEIVDGAGSTAWNKSVITGLCIQGTRTIYTGAATAEGDAADDPVVHPVVHAIKYEARKIKLYSQ